ncbi:Iduronate 2-sulfatase [Ooceraea biroi]|uniref:Iduronate 2-sulfatase n=1 Tax=Ooceraea biroi TaxID=2015173 RepID=A0A026W4G4_OOCBI|nr:Iduronate 2-sulfatase [Ooceraea biroi]
MGYKLIIMLIVIWLNLIAVTLMCNAAARPNFLLIISDDLRTALGCYGDVNAHTPNIDALAKDSIVFTEAFAQNELGSLLFLLLFLLFLLLPTMICPVDVPTMPNQTLPDIEILQQARKFIREHKEDSNPFFLAVGFQKPHIPLKYPERYLKYHPIEKFEIPKPYLWPKNVSNVAYNPWTDLRWRKDVAKLRLKFPWDKIPERFGKLIIQSYYAAVSYVDNMIGKLIHQLRASRIRENTIIILTSDHGWALGEHATWSKYSNFDVAVHVPLIISIPALTYRGSSSKQRICQVTDAIVELVDIFPTIADLAGIPIPICQVNNTGHQSRSRNAFTYQEEPTDPCSEGISLVPLIKDTLKCQSVSWKKAAFSQYPRPGIQPTLHPNSDKPHLRETKIMGYTLKTNNYRYTAWVPFAHETCKPNWDIIIAEELYDHRTDRRESFNIAFLPKMISTKKYLRSLLRNGWRNALPTY